MKVQNMLPTEKPTILKAPPMARVASIEKMSRERVTLRLLDGRWTYEGRLQQAKPMQSWRTKYRGTPRR